MSFVQYYKIRENSLSEERRKLFQEMSLQFDSPDYSDLSDNFFKPEYVKSYLDNSKFIENIKISSGEFSVYLWETYYIFISKENYLAARIEFHKLSDRIKITSIEVARPFKGLMKSIFLDYLLPRYKKIESDNIQTVNAFVFYKKLAIDAVVNKKFDMYVNFDGYGEEKIIDPNQMDDTFGKESYKFFITYILKETVDNN
jgi:hypothetical protein